MNGNDVGFVVVVAGDDDDVVGLSVIVVVVDGSSVDLYYDEDWCGCGNVGERPRSFVGVELGLRWLCQSH